MDKFEQSVDFLMNKIDGPCFFCDKQNCTICDNMDQWHLLEFQVACVVDDVFRIAEVEVEEYND